MKITGKTALVTGASEGIGKAIAEKLADAGVKVIAVSRSIESNPLPDPIISKNCDVSILKSVQELASWIKKEVNSLDIVINNAGIWQKVSQLEEVDDDIVERVIHTNLLGTIYITKALLPLLRAVDEAALVNIISRSGVVAQPGQSVYTASKYGVKGFTDVLREDLKESRIHIMGVYQSGTNTKMFEKTGDDFPTDKFTEPKDLADKIVTAIGSPDKLWINELHVNYR